MSQIQTELYDIFNYAFKLLKKPGTPENRANVSAEVIKFLELLKNQTIDQKVAHFDFNREFFAWLGLQIFTVYLDPELHSELIVERFLEILEIHAPRDPLVLIQLLRTFHESIDDSIGQTYHKAKDDALFVVDDFNVGSTRPERTDCVIGVDTSNGIIPAYRFYQLIIDRCLSVIVELDQSFAFDAIDVLLKMHEFCSVGAIKDKALLLIGRLVPSVVPVTFWEWDKIYCSFYAFYSNLRHPLTPSHWDYLYHSLCSIINRTSGFDACLAEIMFVLSLEVPLIGDTTIPSSQWVQLSVHLLGHIDVTKLDLHIVMPKLIRCDRPEFLPLVESFLVKSVSNSVDIDDSSTNGSSKKPYSVEQTSPTWKTCLHIISKVPTVTYSVSFFEELLNYAAAIISVGRRVSFILNFKHPHYKFQLLGPRCLRSLSAVPFISNECLSDFHLSKYEAVVEYVKKMLGLFGEVESSQLEDQYLIEHVLVILTLPWNSLAEDIDVKVKVSCLDGLVNLLYIMPPHKSTKIVKILTSTVHTKIVDDSDVPTLRKFLSTLCLLLFTISDEALPEVIGIISSYLTPEKVDHLLFNESLHYKVPCLISNRCTVRRGPENWSLMCADCDSVSISKVNFGLLQYVDSMASHFVGSLQKQTLSGDEMAKCYVRCAHHASNLRLPSIVKNIFGILIPAGVQETAIITEVIHRLCYDSQVNKEVVASVWHAMCCYLPASSPQGLIAVLEVTKALLKIPYPSEMSIFKILTTYYLGSIDVCGVRALFKMCLSHRGRDLNKFSKTYEHFLSSYVVNFVLQKAIVEDASIASSFVSILNVLGYKPDANMVGTSWISSILTEVVKMCDADVSIHVISELAELFLVDTKSFIEKHYDQIFTEIYSLEDDTVASKNFISLLQRCGIDLESSIHQNYSQLVCKLILNSKSPLKIFRFLFQSKEQVTDSAEIQLNVLKQHFIGCLTVIESTLSSASDNTVKKYIKCIITFVKILGSKIVTEIQAKLLTTLRTCLPSYYDILPKHCLMAWILFCFSVDVEKISPYIPTILINILPLLDKFPDVVSNVFYYFIVENGHHFCDQLPQLYFIPCHPNVKMQHVWCVVQSSLLVKANSNRNIMTTLDNIYCESTETKIVALERLRCLLKDSASDLISLLQSNNETNQTFEVILSCLLDNITHKSIDVKTLCGACLGELGAIDPMKFGFNDARKSYSCCKYDLMSDDFSVLCITKIVHCLGKYDDSRTTVVLYSTIQELLRIHLLEKNEGQKYNYFAKFSTQDQYVLQPLLQTKYIFKGVKMERNSSNPFSFGYHTTKTPCEWATVWASQLLTRMTSAYPKNLFTTCLPAMRIDMDVMETVLPYILLYTLLSCSEEDVDLIEKEIKYILHWDLTKHRTKPDNLMMIVGESSQSVIHSDASQTKYVAIILNLLDFLSQALSDRDYFEAILGTSEDDDLEGQVKDFLNRFNPCAMSWKSFVQKDHCRALYYYEKGYAEDNIELLPNLKPLRNIYTKLNDIDGLVGVAKSSPTAPSAEEIIVNHVVCGAIQDALSGYERLCAKYESTNTYRGLVQCYININQASTALAVSSQIISGDKYVKPDIFSEHVEALWDSARFQETDRIFNELSEEFLNGHSWSVDLVGALKLLKKSNSKDVVDKIQSIRLSVVNSLCDLNRNGMNLYRQGYWYIVKLHILNDIEALSDFMYSIPPKGGRHQDLNTVWSYLSHRLELLPMRGPYVHDVQKTHLKALDLIFDVAKLKLDEGERNNFSSHLGMMWLDLAKKSRKEGCLLDAYTCIGIAQKYEPSKLFIELAKYYQTKCDTDSAVLVLQQGLNKMPAEPDMATRRMIAKAKLLKASFNVSSMNLDFNDGYSAFKDAAEFCCLEKSFVCLASYLYRQHLSEAEPDNTAAKRFIQVDSARNFSKSLLYGTKHIYQSIPCMLSLWLDYGARIAKLSASTSKKVDQSGMMKTVRDFNSLMNNNLVCLPMYMFMSAFSQILSRINHRLASCFDILKLIICHCITNFPQQAMWSFIAVCRTNNLLQKKRTEDICRIIKTSNQDLARFFKVFNDFSEKLIEIALKKLKYSKRVNLSQLCPQLRPLICAYKHVPIMLPLQKFLTVHISTRKAGDVKQHVPFPLTPVYIADVKELVLMLFSVQMPKRLEFVGSDGGVYPLMCKKDDLRLDSRIMEFNSVINLFLRRDSVAKEKDLSIRTYSVVPLNSECGIIEWLTGLLSLKSIVADMYHKLEIPQMPMGSIKKLMLVQKDEVEMSERLRRFVEVILPQHPPVLHKWFFERHPSADTWYHCRNAFVKSSAVMSIVGYIVGLGDRHGENILIDSTTGEAVHVDFNCLFNRSDLLTYPETVPFRLTHSMVRAMGATGVEGLFVNSCEVTNRVMRHASEQLLSVMKPFLYDIDVKPSRKTATKDTGDDQSNEEAKVNIQNIEMRLNGVVRCKNDQFAPHRNSKPLSVEGQTRMLIREAVSEVNLCQMFAGWAPYM